MRLEGRNAMRIVNLEKSKLLEIVQENKVKHIQEFNEAVEDYKKLVLKISKENLKKCKTEDVLTTLFKIYPTPPRSYEKEYDKAIRMLELSVDDIIEIEENIFNQLVLDEWGLKQSFVTSNSLYKSSL